MAELKPCPFCGGEAEIVERPSVGYSKKACESVQYIARCKNKKCIGRLTVRFCEQDSATKAWNRRAGDGK